jgi:hypothetical protein
MTTDEIRRKRDMENSKEIDEIRRKKSKGPIEIIDEIRRTRDLIINQWHKAIGEREVHREMDHRRTR